MNLSSALYTLLIGPLKLLFEVVYTFAYFLTDNAGLSIVALSLVMNILLMPLYKRADDVQAKENDIQKQLKPGVDHIKKVFKGDEQYMILNAYYRQNGYKPIYALRSSISLLLQIPFFIAAYDYLSNEYTVLSSSFGPIGSLGSPDGLLGGVNLLPILMTVINIISSIIYTKGQPLKNNIQLYVMALAFLVFLYDRPSGLVFYWTLNNLFSLIKNIFMKLKNSKMILCWLMFIAGIAGLVFVLLIHPLGSLLVKLVAIIVMIGLMIPLIWEKLLKDKVSFKENQEKVNDRLFYLEIVLLSIYFGLFIPCQVIDISPGEFVDTMSLTDPMVYVLNTLFLSIGTFCVWFLIYYSLMKDPIRRIFQYVLAIGIVLFAVNYLFFGRDLGTMSNMLIYDEGMSYSSSQILINLAAMFVVFVLVSILYRYKRQFIQAILIVMILTSSIVSIRSIFSIEEDAKRSISEIARSKENRAQIHLSKEGKNVVVIILDRAVNSYFPYIMNERPELKEQFDGFTWYPNTISYSKSTNLGIPSVYGGYEYTPEEMDKREDEYLVDKHNEALRVMPVLFHEEGGFDVTVFDPAYANYQYIGELSVYDDYPYIHAYNTGTGMFDYDSSLIRDNLDLLNRNLFCYGITKSMPLVIQPVLYNGGAYNSINRYESLFSKDELTDISTKAYVKKGFIDAFSVIQNMTSMTQIEEDDSDHLLLMYNMSTHEPTLLQEPDYEVKTNVDNYEYDKQTDYSRDDGNGNVLRFDDYTKMSHYQINIATMMELGKWFDALREEGVYDNTRIILVADHGAPNLHQENEVNFDGTDVLSFNPLLLVKDFDSTGITVDDTFMTNADTIILASEGVIEDPVNPFTGKPLTNEMKSQGYQHLVWSEDISPRDNNGKKFKPGIDFYVKDDLFDLANWKKEQ